MVKEVCSLQEQVFNNLSKTMQNELVLGGVAQIRKENCKTAAKEFFKNKVKVEVDDKDIWYAYRKGSGTMKTIDGERIKCPPQLVARVAPHVKDLVMQNAKNLKGQVDPEGKYKYYVFPNLPEAFRATCAKYKSKVDKISEDNASLPDHQKKKVRVTGTKCFINGVVETELVQPPPPSKVVNRMQLYSESIAEIPLVKTKTETRKGSTFCGYAVRAKMLNTVDMAYVKIRASHPFARHIMLAYNVADHKGSCEDGEWFGDLTMKKVLDDSGLKNVALFMVRIAGEQQIGSQRFNVIRDLSQELITLLNNQVDKAPWDLFGDPFGPPQEDVQDPQQDSEMDWGAEGGDTPTEQW